MPNKYEYELWDGKKVVGTVALLATLVPGILLVPKFSALKEPYGLKEKDRFYTFYVISREIKDYRDTIQRLCIDVRWKRKAQIERLREHLW